MHPAIETSGLSRRFPGGQGVHDLDLHVPAGAIYAFLGPNGAGKTTTIRLLLGLLRAEAGRVHLLGRPLERDRAGALAGVGALVEHPSLYPHLSGRANLDVTRRLLGLPRQRVDEVLERVGLLADADRRCRDYSLGMRQRLGIALALLPRPRLLVLDEPGNGLDPAGTLALRGFLRQLVAEDGLTLFLSSHLLPEVEQVATHVGVLDAGRLRFQGRLEALRARARPRLRLRCDDLARARTLLQALGEAPPAADEDGLAWWPALPVPEINRHLVDAGIAVGHLATEPVTLESLFLDLTGAARPGEAA